MPANDDAPPPTLLFDISHPDANGDVWLCSSADHWDVWELKLGPAAEVRAKLAQWLADQDDAEAF